MNLRLALALGRIAALPWLLFFIEARQSLSFVALLSWVIFARDWRALKGWSLKSGSQVPLGSIARVELAADNAVLAAVSGKLALDGTIHMWFAALIGLRNVSELMTFPLLRGILRIRYEVLARPAAVAATSIAYLFLFTVFLPEVSAIDAVATGAPVLAAWCLMPLGAFLEIYVLRTWLVRFYQVAMGEQNRFD